MLELTQILSFFQNTRMMFKIELTSENQIFGNIAQLLERPRLKIELELHLKTFLPRPELRKEIR